MRRYGRTLPSRVLNLPAAASPSSSRFALRTSGRVRYRVPLGSVERGGHGVEVVAGVPAQVGALGKVPAQQAVGVLIRAALPGAMRIAEVDPQSGDDVELSVLRHLGALVPGQRPAQLLGQGHDRCGDRVPDSLGAVSGQRRAIVASGTDARIASNSACSIRDGSGRQP